MGFHPTLGVAVLLLFCHTADGSHFRFGTVSWGYGGDAKKEPGKITFRIKLAFRRTFSWQWRRATRARAKRAPAAMMEAWHPERPAAMG